MKTQVIYKPSSESNNVLFSLLQIQENCDAELKCGILLRLDCIWFAKPDQMSRSVKQLCKQLLSELSRPIVFLTGKVDKRSNSSTTATLATQRYLNRKFVFQPLKLFKETIVFNNSVVNKWAERKTSLYIFIEQTTFLLNFWTAPSPCLKITFKKSQFST